MRLTPDDPRITAYALNELHGRERAAVERYLSRSPEAREMVELVRGDAALLSSALQSSPVSPLRFEDAAAAAAFGSAAGRNGMLGFVGGARRFGSWSLGSVARAAALTGMAAGMTLMLLPAARIVSGRGGIKVFMNQEGDGVPGDSASIAPLLTSTHGSPIAIVTTPSASQPLTGPVAFGSPYTDNSANSLRRRGGVKSAQRLERLGGRVSANTFTDQFGRVSTGYYDRRSSIYNSARPDGEGSSLSSSARPQTNGQPGFVPYGGVLSMDQLTPIQAGTLEVDAVLVAPITTGLPGGLAFYSQNHLGEGQTVFYADAKPVWAREMVAAYGFEPQGYPFTSFGYQLPYAKRDIAPPPDGFFLHRVEFEGFGRATTIADDTYPIIDLMALVTEASTPTYTPITDNPFLYALSDPLSTFSIDVDTASYTNIRRMLTQGSLPPADAVRIEELLNYFSYNDPPPQDDKPFSANIEVGPCPWNDAHRLVRIGLKGKPIAFDERPATNLVFLVDVSGSMQSPEKLPLVQEGFRLLAEQLRDIDRVAIVVYAGSSGLVLPSTPGSQQSAILDAIDNLQAGGSTNGGEGIRLAYNIARENFIEGGVNRVILATDGDFNVGVTDREQLTTLIQQEARSGVYLTALGFGFDNLNDATLETLADKGNGHYAYIDGPAESDRVFVEQLGGTLVTIAKDVKIQVEFNPARVAGYRLIGYENRLLAAEDFNDDTKDAGEIGAGHGVTALYEIVPAGPEAAGSTATPPGHPGVDPLKYLTPPHLLAAVTDSVPSELLTLKLRYKEPTAAGAPDPETGEVQDEPSKLIEVPAFDNELWLDQTSADFRFAAAVASFGMVLRDSPYRNGCTLELTQELAAGAIVEDAESRRAEFLTLVEQAMMLRNEQ